MKLLNKIRFSAIFLLSTYVIYAQGSSSKNHDHKITDSNPVYIITGNGISNAGSSEMLSFSGVQNNNEIELTDNAIKVKKDGIYRFTLNTNLGTAERKQKEVSYHVILNGKESFNKNQRNLPSNGEFYFQIQLKANDMIAFNVKGNEEIDATKIMSNLKIQFTDPSLIKSEEKH